MSHFGLLCPPYAGHINPMQALGGALIERGHAVTFLGLHGMDAALTDRRIAFGLLGEARGDRVAAMTRHMMHPRGLGLFRILRDAAAATDLICREAPAVVKARGIDALVVDQLEPAGGLVAEAGGLPFVSVANALLINREDTVPPPFLGWPYDVSERGIGRNRAGYRIADILMSGLGRVIARHAARMGLPPRRTMEACLSPLAQISQTVPGFDFPRKAPPPMLTHCGPLRAPTGEADVSDLVDASRPMVFASLGTLQGGRAHVFRRIAEVCQALGLHLVIAHGGRLSSEDIARLPGRPVVRSFVPQRALLRHAALAITNGGLNTVLDALTVGVPVIAIPIAFEQAAIASRLDYRGAGIAMPLTRLTAQSLGKAVQRVLDTPGFAACAAAIAVEIASAGGVERAASLIEAATSKPASARVGAAA